MLDIEWQETEKRIDPDFVGSIWEEMGWDAELCPACDAHLRSGICLNACHLSKASQERFAVIMRATADRISAERKQHEA